MLTMASLCLSSSSTPLYSLNKSNYAPHSSKSNRISFSNSPLGLISLRCSLSSTPRRRFDALVSRASSSDKANEPLWQSLGKSIENFGKKSSVEDLLKQQIEKQEYYDAGGGGKIPPIFRGGGGGGDGFGGSEEEGFSGILDETIQVVLATLGFIFMYVYIINGAEMMRLAKDYFSYLARGRKSIRLTRAMHQWERFCKHFTHKEQMDEFWLEKAIITTPTWWDSPDKYMLLFKALLRKPGANGEGSDGEGNDGEGKDGEGNGEYGSEANDEYGSQANDQMSDDEYYRDS